RSNNAFRLENLAPGAKSWTEEQSRRNFEMASRLVVPGNADAGLLLLHPLAPEAGGSAYHSGGRQFASKNDAEWKILAEGGRGAAAKPNQRSTSVFRRFGTSPTGTVATSFMAPVSPGR